MSIVVDSRCASPYYTCMANTMNTETDRCNVSCSQGWEQEHCGTWIALTRTRSQDGFKSERGARNWFMRNATQSTLAKMGLSK